MEKIVDFCDTCVFLLRSEKGRDCGEEAFECFLEGGEGESGEFALVCVGAFVWGDVGHDGTIGSVDRGRRTVILMALFVGIRHLGSFIFYSPETTYSYVDIYVD